MDYSYKNAGPYMIISTKTVLYSLSRCDSPELYLDRRGAIKLAKTIDKLVPFPWIMQALYDIHERGQMYPGIEPNDDAFIARLSPQIFKHIKLRNGRDLYIINKSQVQQFTERADLEWRVTYEPGEDFDALNRDIEQYLRENTETLQWLLTSNALGQEHNYYTQNNVMVPRSQFVAPQQLAFPPQSAFQQAFQPAPIHQQETSFSQQPLRPPEQQPVTQQALHSASVRDSVRLFHQNSTAVAAQSPGFESIPETARFSPEDTVVQSGYPSPVERPVLLDDMDTIFQGMDGKCGRQSVPAHSSWVSQFELANEQAPIDKKAAERILSLMKVLAINPKMTKSNPQRFSIHSEKEAIKSMTINTSLNIPSSNATLFEKMDRLFSQYNVNDEEGKESFQRAMLMIAIMLLRHNFIYMNGKKEPGNYATDFEKVYKLPAGYLRKAGNLCRILVACGHPCIIVVLVRLALRNQMSLSTLLEQLPITHFCNFVASGKVTNLNNHGQETAHKDLKYLHENVLIPLLHAAKCRVQEQLYIVNGTLVCDQDSCLRAIIHHTQQVKYTEFLNGYHKDAEWARGRVLLENRNTDGRNEKNYSIEKEHRTVSVFELAKFGHIVHLDNYPESLQGRTLSMSLE
jgi:hypothetical protein